ncbi:glycosyltransferase family protein [Kitasatospora sp. McL0602]|uniref:glycosyltransferase family protein n=1 Tax=Kitasatospora sp. McL0602 TaxID=3439530 RepID=UPI003F8CCBF8
MRVLFAGDFHWQAGSAHMIGEYVRAAPALDCEVALAGPLCRLDDQVPSLLPVVDDLAWGTHLVLVFEGRQFLDERRRELCERFPRERRIVLDPDAHWGVHTVLGVDDSAGAYGHQQWQQLYRDLSDVILQPRLGDLPDGARFFPYFGMPKPVHRPERAPATTYDLQYVGANWWRWDALGALVEAARSARPSLTRLRVAGRWWSGDPHPDHLAATANRPGWLAEHGVKVTGPVQFGQVLTQMAKAEITPVLARPLLAHQHLLTPRMFETVAAGTMPVLPPELAYTTGLYGEEITPFILGEEPAEDLARLLRDAPANRQRLGRIQDELRRSFNYRRVLGQLLALTH